MDEEGPIEPQGILEEAPQDSLAIVDDAETEVSILWQEHTKNFLCIYHAECPFRPAFSVCWVTVLSSRVVPPVQTTVCQRQTL